MGDVERLQAAIRDSIREVVDNPEEDDYTLHEIEMALQMEAQLYREEESASSGKKGNA